MPNDSGPVRKRSFPSRSQGFRWHEVWLHPDGSLTCTCPAGERGIRCWAVNKVAGEMEVDRILAKRGIKQPVPDSFDMAAWQIELRVRAQQGLREWAEERERTRPPPDVELAQIKRMWAETDELHRLTRENMTRRRWDRYYAQFKPENQDAD